jgi:hypothetical protein
MMKTKIVLMVVLVALAGFILTSQFSGQKSGPEKSAPQVLTHELRPALASPTPEKIVPDKSPAVAAVAEKIIAPAKPQTRRAGNAPKPKAPIQDPDARTALSLVGADPAAEEYWVAAINDPNLPAHERKDLIEDLNEDGLSDPKHPGPQDLPLIANRLRLIEELAPGAMDAVNADAFAEAYKDLQNLAAGGTAQ